MGSAHHLSRFLFSALLAVMTLAAPAQAQSADPLLDPLLMPHRPPAGAIDALGWVERSGSGYSLVVTLTPRGSARLVADPGVTVVAVQAAEVVWEEDRQYLADPTRAYFEEAPVMRLHFTGAPVSVAAHVDFAWCLVDYQCLFGQALVTAEMPVEG
jgi:hypothetical protein